jgi:manganese/zinc/iron transport system permease protein
MSEMFAFLTLADVNVRYVALGSLLLGATAGAIGCFALLRKRALLGDALAHAALPGVVIGFALTGGKSPLILLIAAMATAWIGALSVSYIAHKSKIKEDTATAIVLSVFFAVGVVGLTLVQKSGAAAQSGLANFLFGHAASMLRGDVIRFSLLALTSLIVLAAFYKEFKLMAFDVEFSRSVGLRTSTLDIILTTLIVVAVVVGLQAVGVVLMAALLITPAAAARLWTNRLSRMLILSASFGAVSGITGAYLSYAVPKMPTGPWVVLAATGIFSVSLLFAPQRGIAARTIRFLLLRRRTLEENILKTFFVLSEVKRQPELAITPSELHQRRFFAGTSLASGLRRLRNEGLVQSDGQHYALTPSGYERAQQVVRKHRLWELYLSEYMQLPPDHVHRDAEEMEHILTTELEAELDAVLERPKVDPHGETIPRNDER